MESSPRSEGDVKHVARRIAHQWKLSTLPGNPNCIISGGEPTVHVPSHHRRNWWAQSAFSLGGSFVAAARRGFPLEGVHQYVNWVSGGPMERMVQRGLQELILNSFVFANMEAAKLDHQDYLHRFDSYHFFVQLGGLLVTGPTGTTCATCELL